MKGIICLVLFLVLCPITVKAQGHTLQDLITEFRGTTGEGDSLNSNFTNALLTDWLNSGQDHVTTLFGPVERDTTYEITLDEAQFRFSLPADFQSIFGVLRIDDTGALGGALVRAPPDSFGVLDQNKGAYHTFGKTIFIDGFNLLQNDSVLVQFYGSATKMAVGTDSCGIQQNLQYLVIDFAISRYEWAKQFWGEGLQIRALIKSDLADSRSSRINTRQTE